MKLRSSENSEEVINVWTSLNDITVCLLFVLILFISIYTYENTPKKEVIPTPTPTLIPTPTPFGNKLEWSEYSGEGKKLMLFAFNSAELTEGFKKALRKSYVNDIYTPYKDSGGKRYIQVEGHTDNIGNYTTNWDLGASRAQSVILYLSTLKPNIPINKFIVISKGEMEPSSSNNTETGRSKNRRIVIKFVMPEK